MNHPTFGEEDKIHGVEAVKPRTAKEKVQNYWYHYKWHTLIALFLLLAVVIASFQLCQKESYDIYVMYAGPKAMMSAQIQQAATALEDLIEDYDGNGKKAVSFSNLYIASAEELRDSGHPDSGTLAANSQQNYQVFQGEIMTGTYRICLLSPRLFQEVDEAGGFVSLTGYAEGRGLSLIGSDGTGVTLSDLPLYAIPALSALPGDTVLCLRRSSVVGNSAEQEERHLQAFLRLLDYNE